MKAKSTSKSPKARTERAKPRSVQRVVRALAIELWEAGVAEVRLREGWSDNKKWNDMGERTKIGMIGIAKYVQNWKRPNSKIERT